MEKSIDWKDIYLDKCMENKDLRKEIRVLQEILRSYLPVIEIKDNSESSRSNNKA
jgi:hypothetical protein